MEAIFCETGLMRPAGITFPANGVAHTVPFTVREVEGSMIWPYRYGWLVQGLICWAPPIMTGPGVAPKAPPFSRSLKSPPNIFAVGTVAPVGFVVQLLWV